MLEIFVIIMFLFEIWWFSSIAHILKYANSA